MKTKIFLLTILILLRLENIYPQSGNPYIPKVLTPSPTAAALMKFTDVPVSKYNGTADVSVPFFNIETKDLTIPVSISYHTGGVKIKDESGPVGLGWALNAGGMISREFRDQDDFGGEYFNEPVPEVTSNIIPQGAIGHPATSFGDGYLFFCDYIMHTGQGDLNYTTALQGGALIWDMEPDIFSYNFPGHSGKFIITRAGKVLMQKQENINIQYTPGGAAFTITDDQGNVFYFANKELVESDNYVGYRTSSWMLTSIFPQSGEVINFTYQTDSSWSFVQADTYDTYRTGCTGAGPHPYIPAANQYLNLTLQKIDFPKGQIQFQIDGNREDLQNGKKYNTITIYTKATGTSALTYLKEYDLYYSYFLAGNTDPIHFERLRLDSLKELSTGINLPPYRFTYNTTGNFLAKNGHAVDHWGFYNGQGGNQTYIPTFSALANGTYIDIEGANRESDFQSASCFSLTQVTYPTGGHTSFEYELNNYDQVRSSNGPVDFPFLKLIPKNFTLNYNGRSTQSGSLDLSNLYPITTTSTNLNLSVTFRAASNMTPYKNTQGKIYFVFNGVTYDVDASQCDTMQPVCHINTQIIISRGQSYNWSVYIDPSIDTLFEGITAFFNWQEIATANNPHLPLDAGGLRIKTITDYSSNGIAAKKRRYAYDNETPSNLFTYGRLMAPPQYARYEDLYYSAPPYGSPLGFASGSYNCTSLTQTGSSNTAVTSAINGNIVGYDTVKEYMVDPITGFDIGKTVYTYFNSADTILPFAGFTLPGVSNMGNNLNGSLLSKIVYRNSNNTYFPVTETDNFYHTENRTPLYSGKYTMLSLTSGYSSDCPGGNCNSNEYLAEFYPSIKSEKILFDSTYETLYDQIDPTKFMLTKKYYAYDNPKHYQVTRSWQQDSKGNTIVNNTKFPQDYIPVGNTLTGNTIIDSMIKRNMVSNTIETRDSLYFNGSSTGFVTGAKLNTYKILSSGSISKDKMYSLTVASPVANFNPYTVNNNVTSQDSRYRQMISFDLYDNLANIQQYTSTDQIPMSFLWDYANNYPIAQVKNAVNSDIAFSSFEADGTGNWNLTTGGGNTSQVSVNVNAAGSNVNLFPTQSSTGVTENDHNQGTTGQELGVKFTSAVAGQIKGIRFYKTSGNTGTHIGELYSSTGTRLAQATFSGETATGWQTVNFTSPVSITANTTYTAAYFSSLGNYTEQDNYFLRNSVTNSPLTAAADGTNGSIGADPGSGQGTYKYTSAAAFPNQLYKAANYWVDVIFTPATTPYANAGPTQTTTLPLSTVVLDGSGSTGSVTSFSWTNISGPSTPVITSATSTFTTVTGLIQGVYVFQLSVNSGASTSQVTINVQAAGTPTTIFTNQTVPTATLNDGTALEVGVKFRASTTGTITGIRFYKTTGNTGTHIGEMYSYPGGTRLAQATFSGETASGWQTVLFSTPVSIAANTTYIASYWSGSGNYPSTSNFYGNPVINGPLTALADGTDGHNAVYSYSTVPAFPTTYTTMFDQPNYWVDVMFLPSSAPVPSAGNNLSVTLPVSSVTLNANNSIGNVSNYLWTKVSGPGSPIIVSPNSATTNVTGLSAGSYVFQLAANGGINSAYGGLTGSKSYNLAGNTITKTGLTTGKKYTLSYWSRGGVVSVSGATSTSTIGRSTNGWTYYEHVLTTTASTISVTGSSYIDELRLYPQGSQMTSLTYTPLVGTTTSNDLNSEITFYEYDSLQRLKNIKDYMGNITNNFQYNYAKACTVCNIPMLTYANTPTISYPVGVFNQWNQLLGNATTQAQYISIWNADGSNSAIGTLSAGADSMHFILTVNTGQNSPGFVTGCRYYQYDLSYNLLDGILKRTGEYVDFGDGSSLFLGKTVADTLDILKGATTSIITYDGTLTNAYFEHHYLDSSLKTITIYHNDGTEIVGLDNALAPATSLTLLKNVRGNYPQHMSGIANSSYQQNTANSISAIYNWNTINSLTLFYLNSGDGGVNTCANMGYAQDFMKNNKGLSTIRTAFNPSDICYFDPTFKLSTLKSDWNTYFTNLQQIFICDEHWNREDLSALVHLNTFVLVNGNQNHSNNLTGNPPTPIPTSVLDNIINQIAAGAGRNVSNGGISIFTGGTSRSSASDAAVTLLKSKGWVIYFNNIPI